MEQWAYKLQNEVTRLLSLINWYQKTQTSYIFQKCDTFVYECISVYLYMREKRIYVKYIIYINISKIYKYVYIFKMEVAFHVISQE